MNGNFIKQWETVDEIQKIFKINKYQIIRVCNYERNSSHGFIWRYIDNPLKSNFKPIRKINCRKVWQYDLQNNFIRMWDAAIDAEKELKINKGHVSAVCLGNRKSAGGFIWKYSQSDDK